MGKLRTAGEWNWQINAAYQTYGKYADVTGPNMSLRQWLVGKPLETHYEWGLKVLNETK